MDNAGNLKKDYMYKEAVERMELLGVNAEHCRLFMNARPVGLVFCQSISINPTTMSIR